MAQTIIFQWKVTRSLWAYQNTVVYGAIDLRGWKKK